MIRIITMLLLLPFSGGAQILYSTGWESGDILQGKFSPFSLAYTSYSGYPSGYSAQVTSEVSRAGSKALRLEVRASDSSVGGSKRAEIGIYTADTAINNNARWFAWSEYLPADYVSDTRNELHFQVHSTATGYTGPNVALWLRSNKWYLNRKWNSTGTNEEVQVELSNSAAALGAWTDWVIFFRPSIGGDGEVKVWRNGELVASVTGPNANNVDGSLEAIRYPKWGVYKWPWSVPGVYYPSTRVVYIDEVRIGGKDAQLSDFTIDATPTTPTPAPGQAINGWLFKTN